MYLFNVRGKKAELMIPLCSMWEFQDVTPIKEVYDTSALYYGIISQKY